MWLVWEVMISPEEYPTKQSCLTFSSTFWRSQGYFRAESLLPNSLRCRNLNVWEGWRPCHIEGVQKESCKVVQRANIEEWFIRRRPHRFDTQAPSSKICQVVLQTRQRSPFFPCAVFVILWLWHSTQSPASVSLVSPIGIMQSEPGSE